MDKKDNYLNFCFKHSKCSSCPRNIKCTEELKKLENENKGEKNGKNNKNR